MLVASQRWANLLSEDIQIATNNGDGPAQLVSGKGDEIEVIILGLVEGGAIVQHQYNLGTASLLIIGRNVEDTPPRLTHQLVCNAQPGFLGMDGTAAAVREPLCQTIAWLK